MTDRHACGHIIFLERTSLLAKFCITSSINVSHITSSSTSARITAPNSFPTEGRRGDAELRSLARSHALKIQPSLCYFSDSGRGSRGNVCTRNGSSVVPSCFDSLETIWWIFVLHLVEFCWVTSYNTLPHIPRAPACRLPHLRRTKPPSLPSRVPVRHIQ